MNIIEEKIRQFLEDEIMYNAVKTAILDNFDLNKIDYSEERTTNENLGQITRAMIEGKDLVQKAFQNMEAYRRGKIKKETVNPAV